MTVLSETGMNVLTKLKWRSHLLVVGATLLQAALQREWHLLYVTPGPSSREHTALRYKQGC